MRIGIDARMLTDQTGIGRYTRWLLQNLVRIDQENAYVIFTNAPLKETLALSENFDERLIASSVFSLAEQVQLPRLIAAEKLDLFHSPSFAAPRYQPCPCVMTIHDLIHLLFPQMFSRGVQAYYELVVKPAAKRTKRIITDSENSKKDIVELLSVHPGKVEVIPLGVNGNYQPHQDQEKLEALRTKLQLPTRFILFVGNRKPHKNLIRLIEAFSELEHRDYSLVAVVDKDPRFISIEDKIKELHLEGRVTVIDEPIREGDLPVLYRAATLFVLPSLYEGFGLPVLEAMACGTPVVVANLSSLPEVVGEAGVLIDPSDTRMLVQTLDRVLGDDLLRAELSRKGLARAKLFSWEKTARRTLEVYGEVYRESKLSKA